MVVVNLIMLAPSFTAATFEGAPRHARPLGQPACSDDYADAAIFGLDFLSEYIKEL